MNHSERYRVALVGCGDIAETGHVPALLQHPRFTIATLCDIRQARAEFLSQKAGRVPVCTDYRRLLDSEDFDAVILALHPEVSVNVAIDFLQHGKPVLDEKPLASTLEDGRRLSQAVSETDAIYQIGFVFRYCRAVQQIAEIAGQIGTPALYRVGIFDELLDPDNQEHFERIQQILRHSSAITHEGSHVIDFFQQWNSSPIERVHAGAIQTDKSFNGPNIWSTQFRTADGSILELDIGWLLPQLPPSTISIVGPHGFFQLDMRSGRGEFNCRGNSEVVQIDPFVQNWSTQLDVFASAIDQGRAQTATVDDGLRVLTATVGCELSHRKGTVVPLMNDFIA